MALKDEIEKYIDATLSTKWTTRKGQKVPEDSDLKLTNDGVELDATCLYVDMVQSTKLVDNYKPEFAAEIYKSFLYTSSKVIRFQGGTITAYDGDRVMAVYIGDSKNSNAAKTALKINYAVKKIINPAIKKQYNNDYEIKHVVGIDSSKLLVAKTGIRGSNDLVWIGKAGNHAAKLCDIRKEDYATWITKNVYNRLSDETKFSKNKDMWKKHNWTQMDNIEVYASKFWWII